MTFLLICSFVGLGAVAIATSLGGFRHGLLTAVVSIVALDLFAVHPKGSLRVLAATDAVLLLAYVGTALLIWFITARLRTQRDQVRAEAERVAHLAEFLERALSERDNEFESLVTLHGVRHRNGAISEDAP